jgi:hypothetical protein
LPVFFAGYDGMILKKSSRAVEDNLITNEQRGRKNMGVKK